MEYSVGFRPFEERDIDFVYKCKNDEKLNSMIVGQFRPFAYQEAEQWVRGVIRADKKDMKFWAICTNDSDRRIIGWESISEIDLEIKSACHHGLVIGDPEYKDGTAMFEAMLFAMDYVFLELKLHRLYGSCLAEHKISPFLLKALGFVQEGQKRDAYYKNGAYYDILDFGILDEDYYNNMKNGAYKLPVLIKNFLRSLKYL